MKKIMLLSNNEMVQSLYEWLLQKGYETVLFHNPITLDAVQEFEPDLEAFLSGRPLDYTMTISQFKQSYIAGNDNLFTRQSRQRLKG